MTSARRLLAAVSLAAGAAALAAPSAQAAPSAPAAPSAQDRAPISVLETIDALGTTAIPADQRAAVPGLASQLQGLNQLNQLSQLHQLTDMVQPVTNLVPSVA